MGPVAHALHQAMFERVDVDVVDVRTDVVVVVQEMLPAMVSPRTTAAFTMNADAHAAPSQRGGEARFDEPPAPRVVRVVRGQLPDAVQVFGQDHRRVRDERPVRAHCGIGFAKQVDVLA